MPSARHPSLTALPRLEKGFSPVWAPAPGAPAFSYGRTPVKNGEMNLCVRCACPRRSIGPGNLVWPSVMCVAGICSKRRIYITVTGRKACGRPEESSHRSGAPVTVYCFKYSPGCVVDPGCGLRHRDSGLGFDQTGISCGLRFAESLSYPMCSAGAGKGLPNLPMHL